MKRSGSMCRGRRPVIPSPNTTTADNNKRTRARIRTSNSMTRISRAVGLELNDAKDGRNAESPDVSSIWAPAGTSATKRAGRTRAGANRRRPRIAVECAVVSMSPELPGATLAGASVKQRQPNVTRDVVGVKSWSTATSRRRAAIARRGARHRDSGVTNAASARTDPRWPPTLLACRPAPGAWVNRPLSSPQPASTP
jgi:hypothetical protein